MPVAVAVAVVAAVPVDMVPHIRSSAEVARARDPSLTPQRVVLGHSAAPEPHSYGCDRHTGLARQRPAAENNSCWAGRMGRQHHQPSLSVRFGLSSFPSPFRVLFSRKRSQKTNAKWSWRRNDSGVVSSRGLCGDRCVECAGMGGGPPGLGRDGSRARLGSALHRAVLRAPVPAFLQHYTDVLAIRTLCSRGAPDDARGRECWGRAGQRESPGVGVWVRGCVAFSPSDTLRRACSRRLPPPPLRLAGPCWLARPRSRPLRPCTTRFLSWQLRLTRWRRRPVASVASAPRTSSAHTLRC